MQTEFYLDFTLGKPNVNGRIYHKEGFVASMKEFMDKKIRPVVLGIRDESHVDLHQFAGDMKSFEVIGDNIKVSVSILSTPAGKIVKDLVGTGVKLGLSPAGASKVDIDNVVSDFKIAQLILIK